MYLYHARKATIHFLFFANTRIFIYDKNYADAVEFTHIYYICYEIIVFVWKKIIPLAYKKICQKDHISMDLDRLRFTITTPEATNIYAQNLAGSLETGIDFLAPKFFNKLSDNLKKFGNFEIQNKKKYLAKKSYYNYNQFLCDSVELSDFV